MVIFIPLRYTSHATAASTAVIAGNGAYGRYMRPLGVAGAYGRIVRIA